MYIIYSLETIVLLYVVYGMNVLLHGIGVTLMIKMRKPSGRSNQDYFLINLAAGDFLKSVVSIIGVVTYSRLHASADPAVWSEVWKVVVSVNSFGLYLWQYVAIMLVTMDRLLTVLHRSYTQLWSRKRTKILIATCWVLELMGCLAPYLVNKLGGFNNENMIDIYIKTSLDIIFIFLSVASYSAMFGKFVRSHRRTVRVQQNSIFQQNTRQPQTAWQLFRRSRFVIAILLITSFLLCVAIPDIVLSVLVFKGQQVPDVLFKVFLFLSAVSDMVDGFVYVFLRAEVRKMFRRLFRLSGVGRKLRSSFVTVSGIRRRRRVASQSTTMKSFTISQ